MSELQTDQLRERGEEVLGKGLEGLGPLIVLPRHLPPEVVDGVPAAEEDPVVRGQPVVVETIRAVADALAALPPDRRHLLVSERLGHQRVVVDGDRMQTHPFEQRREHVRRQRHPLRRDRAARSGCAFLDRLRSHAGLHLHGRLRIADIGDLRALIDLDSEFADDAQQLPAQFRRVDHCYLA